VVLLEVTLLNPRAVLFEGRARSVVLPGEQGVFEVLPLHKRIVSRLISGTLLIDEQAFPIKRGIAQVDQNQVTVIIEEAA